MEKYFIEICTGENENGCPIMQRIEQEAEGYTIEEAEDFAKEYLTELVSDDETLSDEQKEALYKKIENRSYFRLIPRFRKVWYVVDLEALQNFETGIVNELEGYEDIDEAKEDFKKRFKTEEGAAGYELHCIEEDDWTYYETIEKLTPYQIF